ncbi:MAG: hypothetical protein HWE30_13880 [Methylocystaceae bacterium]|nr:hypothetical protein [Methylocystaceae bacterium]
MHILRLLFFVTVLSISTNAYAGGGAGGGGSASSSPTSISTTVAGPNAVIAAVTVPLDISKMASKALDENQNSSEGQDQCTSRYCLEVKILIEQQTKALQKLLSVSYMVSQMRQSDDITNTVLSSSVVAELVTLSKQAIK